ncbi:hypothetical protein GGI04_004391 [Coemansia thaxteri]|uniref:Uncharacterized protein n=1 Tax=Coemansia thaxteri TaxID=2663907 RepID=A0A9W8BGV9_9FUNG|nr:hypothetical protein GGI04_004391 [Coemansia thaxteri]KAJ2004889.1 hypothetical protein H4R26_002266 [Coemansia thaxteri]KAJ2468299.1 hypothetical protein GGI02_003744 [Coemansia sp. RSA 2322]KAJ2486511.1 hypothetical protein EV174_001081 [Coemansia sp. RSA 2320]
MIASGHSQRAASSRRREAAATSEWSCVACAPQSSCYNQYTTRSVGGYRRGGRRNELSESKAMGVALVLAEQYVREVERYPTTEEEWEEWEESALRQAALSLPMSSTRSRDVRPRTVSSGSTVCEPAAGSSVGSGSGKPYANNGPGRILLRRPARWIRGMLGLKPYD